MSVPNGVEAAAEALRAVLADLDAQRKTIQASLDLLEGISVSVRSGPPLPIAPNSNGRTGSFLEALAAVTPKAATVQIIGDVLKESSNVPLHVNEIWRRAVARGAHTDSSDVERIVYNNIQKLMEKGLPISKVPNVTQTYVWIAEKAQATS